MARRPRELGAAAGGLEPERPQQHLADLVLRGLLEHRQELAQRDGLVDEQRVGLGGVGVGVGGRSSSNHDSCRPAADRDATRGQRRGERVEIRARRVAVRDVEARAVARLDRPGDADDVADRVGGRSRRAEVLDAIGRRVVARRGHRLHVHAQRARRRHDRHRRRLPRHGAAHGDARERLVEHQLVHRRRVRRSRSRRTPSRTRRSRQGTRRAPSAACRRCAGRRARTASRPSARRGVIASPWTLVLMVGSPLPITSRSPCSVPSTHRPAGGECGAEAVVRPEPRERDGAGDDLLVGGRHEQLAGVVRVERVAPHGVDDQDSPVRVAELGRLHHRVDSSHERRPVGDDEPADGFRRDGAGDRGRRAGREDRDREGAGCRDAAAAAQGGVKWAHAQETSTPAPVMLESQAPAFRRCVELRGERPLDDQVAAPAARPLLHVPAAPVADHQVVADVGRRDRARPSAYHGRRSRGSPCAPCASACRSARR